MKEGIGPEFGKNGKVRRSGDRLLVAGPELYLRYRSSFAYTNASFVTPLGTLTIGVSAPIEEWHEHDLILILRDSQRGTDAMYKRLLGWETVLQAHVCELIGKSQAGMILTAFTDSGEVIWRELSDTYQVLMCVGL